MPETVTPKTKPASLVLFSLCDPKSSLSNAYAADDIRNKPELLVLDWLVALPSAIDPALAARTVLLNLRLKRKPTSRDQQSLLTLLEEIACHPRKKLLESVSKKRRKQPRGT